MSFEFWRQPKVSQIVGLRRATIYRRIAEGTFPAPISLGARAVAWNSADVLRWMEERLKDAMSTDNRAMRRPSIAKEDRQIASL